MIEGCLSWFDCELEDVLPGGDHEILVGRVVAAGGRAGEPLVYWAGGYRALRADEPASDRLADAADGLSVALLLLDVGVAEMLDAQRTIEPALAGLAAVHGTAEHWDRLDRLIAESAAAVDEPDRFNELALASHDLIADAAGNRVLYATLISLRQVQSRHYRDLGSPETARASVADHRDCWPRCAAEAPRMPPVRCSSISKSSDEISTPDGPVGRLRAQRTRRPRFSRIQGWFARTTDETARADAAAMSWAPK